MKTAKQSKNSQTVRTAALSLLATLAVFIIPTLVLPLQNTYADRITLTVKNVGYYAQLTSSASANGLNFNLTPGDGINKKTDNLNVKTNARNGYKVYISTEGNDNNLKLEGAAAGLNEDQSNIKPVTGTTIAVNTWGFSLNGGTTWGAVPIKGREVMIKSDSSPNAQSNGVNFDVDYGVSVDSSIAAGVYKNRVVYTVVADSTTVSFPASVSPNTLALTGGTITITVPLYANYNLTANEVQATVGGTACSNLNITKQDNQWIEFTCTAPAKETGPHEVRVNIPKAATTEAISAGNINYN